ncbi:hypothetical protein ACH5RR_016523 [Cinchona calisaya]|uniref:RING-type domain-containing protein n=1 Tax=Cinchona calisaya TaxID=153742 RepID=A0ABD2ZW89_9GENT
MNSTSNSTNESPDDYKNQGQETVGPYGFSIGIVFGMITILIIITYCYYIYTRLRAADINTSHNNRSIFHRNSVNDNGTASSSSVNDELASMPRGLDEATLLGYPKLLYSQAKNNQDDEGGCNNNTNNNASGCSICLQEYKDTDMLRLLPECGHFFHLKCLDPWLKMHPTCPICRNSPMPSPLQTPVLEMAPPLSLRVRIDG